MSWVSLEEWDHEMACCMFSFEVLKSVSRCNTMDRIQWYCVQALCYPLSVMGWQAIILVFSRLKHRSVWYWYMCRIEILLNTLISTNESKLRQYTKSWKHAGSIGGFWVRRSQGIGQRQSMSPTSPPSGSCTSLGLVHLPLFLPPSPGRRATRSQTITCHGEHNTTTTRMTTTTTKVGIRWSMRLFDGHSMRSRGSWLVWRWFRLELPGSVCWKASYSSVLYLNPS